MKHHVGYEPAREPLRPTVFYPQILIELRRPHSSDIIHALLLLSGDTTCQKRTEIIPFLQLFGENSFSFLSRRDFGVVANAKTLNFGFSKISSSTHRATCKGRGLYAFRVINKL